MRTHFQRNSRRMSRVFAVTMISLIGAALLLGCTNPKRSPEAQQAFSAYKPLTDALQSMPPSQYPKNAEAFFKTYGRDYVIAPNDGLDRYLVTSKNNPAASYKLSYSYDGSSYTSGDGKPSVHLGLSGVGRIYCAWKTFTQSWACWP